MDFEVESLDNAFFGFGVEDARKPYVSCRGCLAGPLFIVSASRSPPGLDSKGSTFGAHFRLAPKRVDFWRSFSHSGLFLEPFLAHVWFIFRLFWLIFRSWAHFGSAGGPLFHHKNGLDHQRRPNRHFPENDFIFFGAILDDFL